MAGAATDVAIVGGGVAGLATALYLAREGARVVVVESNRVGSGASSGNAGWLCPTQAGPLPEPGLAAYGLRALVDRSSALYFAPAELPRLVPWLLRFQAHCTPGAWARGVRALSALGGPVFAMVDELVAAGLDVELHKRGLLAVGDPGQAAHFLAGLAPAREAGLGVPDRVLDRDELHALEPGLSGAATAGVQVAQHWHVRPESFVAGLARLVREAGGEIREGAEVQDVEVDGARVLRLRTAAGVLAPEAVVLAAGAWSGTLARRLGLRLPLTAGKGYSFTVEPVTPPRHALSLLDPHVGCSPLADGRMRIAGTMELSGVNLRLDRRRLATIVAGARRYLGPWRGDEPADAWVGMRPLVPDGLPVIDRVAPGSNAYVATAYSMLGMTLALPAGRALAELVLRGRRPDVLAPFAADRFTLRSSLGRALPRG